MVVVPAGSFRMGDLNGGGADDEKPVHTVTIGEAFAVGKYEVTFAEWDACVAAGGCNGRRSVDAGWGRSRRPVINVSWDDAKRYVSWLSSRTGRRYRLLSEAEWEYAARAGTTTKWSCGSSEGCLNAVAWYSANSGNRTFPVGAKVANAFGLYDMHGNVWEWVEDCWTDSYAGAPSGGWAWTSGDCSGHVLRGGSWLIEPGKVRSANRNRIITGDRGYSIGFRIARTLN